ncbi:RNA ligase-domain-containing protein [Absidia repens]|uniref:RNA ligase-domain-containing protein n=1 Tax=Absidia repens TaxID=90262 RepID=A0A1X2IJN3_9FUNG|nr:RNA ligase-domain-containing protein [Absidia repens]
MDVLDFNLEWEEQDHQVIEALYTLQQEKPKELRHKGFQVNGSEWISWTMRDHLYKKYRYPTQARGLFTMRQADGRHVVKVRGYDKFFNINETEVTQWHVLEKETHGPYDITAKENGCIIFIAAASSTDLIATSKHTIPEPKDSQSSHGGMGYRWLLQHLASVNCAPESLAAWLHHHRVTLVAELCDDDFEEHVVPYRTDRGLYLHGINFNTTTLRTWPIQQVHQVAKQFGFRTVATRPIPDLPSVRRLANTIQQNTTGVLTWMDEEEARESEGIVIRCRRRRQQQQHDEDFFFKVKNDTYLVYREYREVTKALVEVVTDDTNNDRPRVIFKTAGGAGAGKKPKIRFEKTLYYVPWLRARVLDHPEWFYQYASNKGVVAVRQAFEKDWHDGKLVELDVDNLDSLVERDSR